MAEEALRITVDTEVYKKTLDDLDAKLSTLRQHKDSLETQLSKLKSGRTFGGSATRNAIAKTEKGLEAVKDGISRVYGYRQSIEKMANLTSSTTDTLDAKINGIDIPNMFD